MEDQRLSRSQRGDDMTCVYDETVDTERQSIQTTNPMGISSNLSDAQGARRCCNKRGCASVETRENGPSGEYSAAPRNWREKRKGGAQSLRTVWRRP